MRVLSRWYVYANHRSVHRTGNAFLERKKKREKVKLKIINLRMLEIILKEAGRKN